MNLFTFIKQNLSILDVVREFVTLKKAGHYWKGVCPFHHEKTGSFTVSPHKDIFYCFGCHEGGDVITFITKVEHCSPLQASQYLIERYALDVPEELLKQAHTPQETDKKKEYETICELVAQWAHTQLKQNSTVTNYLTQRGFSAESIDKFTIGYFPGGLHAINKIINHAQRHNILAQDLIDAHIVVQGKKVLYSPFEERILFPIYDHLGRCCGFGGRVFKPQDMRAKYYNSRENAFFTKNNLLFGLDKAKSAIQEHETVYLVEGYTDCISMVQYGYKNTVATLGTACSISHLKQLSRYAHTLYILYDGDSAGQKAIVRLTELCWNLDLELRVMTLPAQEDPASYLEKHGSLEPLGGGHDIFEFYVASQGANFAHASMGKKIKAARDFIKNVAQLKDPLKQDLLLAKASAAFDIPFNSLKQELQSHTAESGAKDSNRKETPAIEAPTPLGKISELEKKIFSAIINNTELLKQEDELYLLQYLAPPLKNLLHTLKEYEQGDPVNQFNMFYASLQPHEQQLVSRLTVEFNGSEDPEYFEQLLTQFQKKQWKTIVEDIKREMSHAETVHNTRHIEQLLTRFQSLKQKLIKKGLI